MTTGYSIERVEDDGELTLVERGIPTEEEAIREAWFAADLIGAQMIVRRPDGTLLGKTADR